MARMPDPQVRQRWKRRLQQFQRSGLTVAEFCRSEGVSAASFYQWRRKLSDDDGAPGTELPQFLPVTLTDASPAQQTGSSIELSLPGGAVLKLPADADRRMLLDAVQAAVQATAQTPVDEGLPPC